MLRLGVCVGAKPYGKFFNSRGGFLGGSTALLSQPIPKSLNPVFNLERLPNQKTGKSQTVNIGQIVWAGGGT